MRLESQKRWESDSATESCIVSRNLSASMSTDWRSNLFKYSPDLDSYFSRIGYTGSRVPTAENLKQIQWHHLLSIAFENLNPHLGQAIDLDPKVIENKLVRENRGGYCFEHNGLFLHVLRALGYDVTPILARTRWQKPVDIISPPTHMILKVKIDGVLWMADVGFSSFGSPYPLEIESSKEQVTPLESRRVVRVGEYDYMHQIWFGGTWADVFVFTLCESFPMDWEVGSHWVATHPESFGVLNSIVSMPTPTCRYLLLNKTFKTAYPDGTNTIVEISTEAEYFEVLRSVFKLHFPEGTTIRIGGKPW